MPIAILARAVHFRAIARDTRRATRRFSNIYSGRHDMTTDTAKDPITVSHWGAYRVAASNGRASTTATANTMAFAQASQGLRSTFTGTSASVPTTASMPSVGAGGGVDVFEGGDGVWSIDLRVYFLRADRFR